MRMRKNAQAKANAQRRTCKGARAKACMHKLTRKSFCSRGQMQYNRQYNRRIGMKAQRRTCREDQRGKYHSLHSWPPVWPVWIGLFCKLKQKLSIVITDLYCESRLDKNLWAELAVLLLNSWETAKKCVRAIDLKRITRCNLGIIRVGHFWKCYGSEASKS